MTNQPQSSRFPTPPVVGTDYNREMTTDNLEADSVQSYNTSKINEQHQRSATLNTESATVETTNPHESSKSLSALEVEHIEQNIE